MYCTVQYNLVVQYISGSRTVLYCSKLVKLWRDDDRDVGKKDPHPVEVALEIAAAKSTHPNNNNH